MTKKHFIALADAIIDHDNMVSKIGGTQFQPTQLDSLATFLQRQNPKFDRQRWLGYINGFNGPNGGQPKPRRTVVYSVTISNPLPVPAEAPPAPEPEMRAW